MSTSFKMQFKQNTKRNTYQVLRAWTTLAFMSISPGGFTRQLRTLQWPILHRSWGHVQDMQGEPRSSVPGIYLTWKRKKRKEFSWIYATYGAGFNWVTDIGIVIKKILSSRKLHISTQEATTEIQKRERKLSQIQNRLLLSAVSSENWELWREDFQGFGFALQ